MENETMNLIPAEEAVEEIALDAEETAAPEVVTAQDQIAQKCREIKELCAKTANRLADDWRETNGNPYIRQTRTTKIEIFRNPDDETPVDTFQTTDVKSYSLRALAIATGIASILFCASGNLVRKFLTPGE
jgi:hypothetical protein